MEDLLGENINSLIACNEQQLMQSLAFTDAFCSSAFITNCAKVTNTLPFM